MDKKQFISEVLESIEDHLYVKIHHTDKMMHDFEGLKKDALHASDDDSYQYAQEQYDMYSEQNDILHDIRVKINNLFED